MVLALVPVLALARPRLRGFLAHRTIGQPFGFEWGHDRMHGVAKFMPGRMARGGCRAVTPGGLPATQAGPGTRLARLLLQEVRNP